MRPTTMPGPGRSRHRAPAESVAGSPLGSHGCHRRTFPATGGHEQADVVLVRGPTVHDRHDSPSEHHGDPVGEFEDLIELGRDEQDCGPGVTFADRLLVDEFDATDVEATGRLVEDEQPEFATE